MAATSDRRAGDRLAGDQRGRAGGRSAIAELVGAASMASAAALVGRIRQHPPLPSPPPREGLIPMEPSGALAKVAARGPRLRAAASVAQRYSTTQCGQLAALVAFTGFLSIFPLLISLNTTLDLVLSGHPDLRHRLVRTTVGSIPVIGEQLKVGTSKGSGLALALGLAGAMWAALAAMNALQTAFADVWQVTDRPNLITTRLKSVAGLGVVGVALICGTGLAGVATGSHLPGAAVWGVAGAIGVNVVGVAGAQVVLGAKVARGSVWPGAAVSGVLLTVLQVAGGLLVTRYLVGASATYGTFATVIALTSWFGLNAQAVLVGVALNAERAARRAT